MISLVGWAKPLDLFAILLGRHELFTFRYKSSKAVAWHVEVLTLCTNVSCNSTGGVHAGGGGVLGRALMCLTPYYCWTMYLMIGCCHTAALWSTMAGLGLLLQVHSCARLCSAVLCRACCAVSWCAMLTLLCFAYLTLGLCCCAVLQCSVMSSHAAG